VSFQKKLQHAPFQLSGMADPAVAQMVKCPPSQNQKSTEDSVDPEQLARSLLTRMATGDEEAARAFEALFSSRLARLARSASVPNQDVGDVVQEVLLAVSRESRLMRFRSESSVTTWLFSILKHKVLDYKRRQVRREKPLVALETEGVVLVSAEHKQGERRLTMEERLEIREVLSGLSQEHRRILLLKENVGWSIEEIASRLKMKAGTVSRKIWEAKQEMRKKILRLEQ